MDLKNIENTQYQDLMARASSTEDDDKKDPKEKDDKDRQEDEDDEDSEKGKKRSSKNDEDPAEDKEDKEEKDSKDDKKSSSDGKKDESRTVELVWTTGAGVVRIDENGNNYVERLSLDPSSVNLDRLNSGNAPLLNSHSRDGIADVIGVIEKAWIDSEKGEGRAIVRFSRRPDVAPILQDVRDGILKNTSVGYKVHRFEDQMDDGVLTKTATEWEPLEISLVGIPADAKSQIRKKLNEGVQVRMLNQQNNAKIERDRILEIQKATRAAGLDEEFSKRLVDQEVNLHQARKLILDEMSKTKSPETRNYLDVRAGNQDEVETRKKGLENALLNRMNPSKNKLDDYGKPYYGISLFDAGKECIKRSFPIQGFYHSPVKIAERAMNASSDFPYILNNVLNKSLRQPFESAPATYKAFTKTITTRDFKPIYRIQLGEGPMLEPLNEQGEFHRGTIGETQEVYRPTTFGKTVAVTRETIVSDDLSALTRVSELLGRAAADHISENVYAKLCNNPQMSSGPLFDSTHFNVAPKADIDIKALAAGRTAMRLQKGQAGRVLNLTPRTLLVPAALETRAQQYLGQSTLYSLISSQKNSAVEQQINPFAGALNIVTEPRLDSYSDSTWYLITDIAQCDVFELAFLEGQEGPVLDSEITFGTGGVSYACRLEYGIGAIEWRSWYRVGNGIDTKSN